MQKVYYPPLPSFPAAVENSIASPIAFDVSPPDSERGTPRPVGSLRVGAALEQGLSSVFNITYIVPSPRGSIENIFKGKRVKSFNSVCVELVTHFCNDVAT